MENKDKQILKAGSFYYSDGTFSNELDKSKTCIGICVIPPNFLPDGKARIMSLKEMDYNNPEKGSLQHVGMCWGQYGVDTPIKNQTLFTTIDKKAIGSYDRTIVGSSDEYGFLPTNRKNNALKTRKENKVDKGTTWNCIADIYLPSPYMVVNGKELLCPEYNSGAMSDFDGNGNTNILTKLHTVEDWKTVDKITNNSGPNYSPAAVCCTRYKTEGTQCGDWYLPSIGELGFVMARFKEIQNSLKTLGEQIAIALDDIHGYYWSSSEYDIEISFFMDARSACFEYVSKDYDDPFVRAFLMV